MKFFPILQFNLRSVAGEWSGFDEHWLVDEIVYSLEKRNIARSIQIEISYLLYDRMNNEYWKGLEEIFKGI